VGYAISIGECVAMAIWQIVDCSIRRISFRNSIWRAGDSADFGLSKMKVRCLWHHS
jgi:hypothetical protein